ncbi:MAG: GAF domain-containing protein [Methylococcaceae bacterium]|nr:GAF domain-containing protein [Methylococcaceae bacterium]
MKQPKIRILLLEDVATDAELIERALRKSAIDFTALRVETKEGFLHAIAEFAPDVVLADNQLPAFSASAALELLRERHPEIPAIIVTGTMGDAAVDLLKLGAKDYILKDSLTRLGPAVQGALAFEEARRLRNRAEEQVFRLAAVVNQAEDSIVITDLEGNIVYVNPFFERLTGYCTAEVLGQNPRFLKSGYQSEQFYRQLWETISAGKVWTGQFANKRKDGSIFFEEATLFPIKDGAGSIINFAAVKRDVSLRLQAEAHLRKLTRLHATLSHVNETIVRARDQDTLFRQICRDAVENGNFVMAWVGLADEVTRKVQPFCQSRDNDGYLAGIQIGIDDVPLGRGPTGSAFREGRVSYVNDYANDDRVLPWRESALHCGFRGAAALPLYRGGKVAAVLTLYVGEAFFFDRDQLELLEEMSADISFALDGFERELSRQQAERGREAALQKLHKTLRNTIQLAATTLERRDPYTAGHQQRVAKLATAIAAEMGLSELQIEGIGFGGLIHDIGKISIPTEILVCTRRLSPLEMEFVQTHSQIGYEIVKDLEFPWPVAAMIRQHHEWLDGSGYPQGLKGVEIILEARILTVADVVESMSSHRPYRPALGIEAALAEITHYRGIRFDPAVVDACLSLFLQQRFSFS